MKKLLRTILLLFCLTLSYLIYDEFSFSPLKNKEIKKLFEVYQDDAKKVCSKDFLGINAKGEYFEIYQYKVNSASVSPNFPRFESSWENRSFTSETVSIKWKNCPVDSQAAKLCDFDLLNNYISKGSCIKSLKKDLVTPTNFYSYVYFSEVEHYFLLCCPGRQELYYIRRKGF